MNDSRSAVYPLGPKVAAHAAIGAILAGWTGHYLQGKCGLGPLAPVLAVSVIAVMFATSEQARRTHKPPRFGHANRITLTRGVIVSGVAAFIGSAGGETYALEVAVAASIALAMDGLDGMVARWTGLMSPYGAQLDMELDSLLMLILSILAWQWGAAGPWVLFCGLVRYGWVAGCLLLPWLNRQLPPAFRRKTACVVGIGALIGAIVPWAWPWFATFSAAVATASLAWSFGVDGWWLFRLRHEEL